MDVAHKETDIVIDLVERKVKKQYALAQKEIEKKADAYFAAFAEKDKKKLALVDAKEMSREAYNEWRKQQLLVGNKWDQMSISLSEDLSNARKISASIVKGHMPEVYAENFNYSTYEIEAGLNINTSFTLYDKQTVERLLRENPKLLPDPSKKVKDKIRQKEIQRWSRQRMTSALTQAILQGESLDKLAKRLRSVTSMDAASSIRNARTMLTNAQSAGRYDGYRRAKERGVKFKVMWIATLDGRTRHEHRLLDGQMQEVDEPFHVGNTEIMYPADYGGKNYKVPPDMIYNCRCTIGAAVKGTRLYDEGIGAVNREVGTGQTYEDWKKGHPSRKKNNTSVATKSQNNDIATNNIHGYTYGEKALFPMFTDDGYEEHTVTVKKEKNYKFPDGTYNGVYQTRDADVYELDNGVKVIYPSDIDTVKQTKTPDMIIESIYKLPPALQGKMQRVIHVVDYDNPQDKKWEKRYNIKGFKSYATGGKEMTFYASKHYTDLVGTLAHESGHYIDDYIKGDYVGARISGSEQWRQAVAKDLADTGHDAPTGYARQAAKSTSGNTKYKEDFAESVKAWVLDKEKFKEKFPNRYNLVDGYVEGWMD